MPKEPVVAETDGLDGTVSLLTFPDLGLAMAAAANVTHAAGVHPFALQVAEAFTRHQNR